MPYLTPYKLKQMRPGERLHRRLPAESRKPFQNLEIVKIDPEPEIVNVRAYFERPVYSFDLHLTQDTDFIHGLRPGIW